jgi:hypothetical protein
MKLMAKCRYCERDLLLSLLVEPTTAGRCPWCGASLVRRHYTMLLPRLIDEAERAGQKLGSALRMLSEGWTGTQINKGSVLGPIEASILVEDSDVRVAEGKERRPRTHPSVRQAA